MTWAKGGRGTVDPVRRVPVPAHLAVGRPELAAADYAVAFRTTPVAAALSPEEWLREVFEHSSTPMRWFLLLGWTALTCRLQRRRAPTHVLGWRIEQSSGDVAVIVVTARVGLTSRTVVCADGDQVTLASLVHFTARRPAVARAVWRLTIPLHEVMLPHLLSAAAQRRTPSPA